MTPKALRQNAVIFFTLLAGGLFLYIILPYLTAVVLAITFALFMYPLYERIATYVGKGHVATTATVAITSLLIVLPLLFVLQWLSQTTTVLYTEMQADNFAFIDRFIAPLSGFGDLIGLDVDISSGGLLPELLSWLSNNFNSLFSATVHIGISLVLWLILFYFTIKDGHQLVSSVVTRSPLGVQATERILSRIQNMVNAVVKVSLLMGVFQGAMAGLGFWLFGIPNPVLLGALTVIVSLLPAIGVTAITVSAAVYLFYTNGLLWAIGLLIWAALLVGVAEDLLRPYIVGRYNNVHTALILLSVLGGISAFGLVGLVLGPITLSFFLGVLEATRDEFGTKAARSKA